MSNSNLVGYTRLSPNCTKPRNHKIDTITIHCYVGQVTAERGCDGFANPAREASCNYVIGYDGKIGLCVEEENRSWCSGGKDKNGNVIRVNGVSGKDNDHRAITIEVASDTKHPYAVTEKAYAALIDLCVDICERNGIKQLLWKGDKSLVGKVDQQNMTVHRWFANKSCPGDYLYNKHGEIAAEVNKRLGATQKEETEPTVNENDLVSISSNATYYTGKSVPSWVKKTQWYVAEVHGDRAVLGKSADGKNNINSAINTKYLTVVSKSTDTFEPYKVKVNTASLNIRKGPGTNYAKTGKITDRGVYTIIAVSKGKGATGGWGQLKSKAGWVSLDYCVKL